MSSFPVKEDVLYDDPDVVEKEVKAEVKEIPELSEWRCAVQCKRCDAWRPVDADDGARFTFALSGGLIVIAMVDLLKDSNAITPTDEDAMAAAIPAADALSKSAKQSKDGGVKQAVKAKIEAASNGDLAGVNNRSCRPNLGNSPSSDGAIGRHN